VLVGRPGRAGSYRTVQPGTGQDAQRHAGLVARSASSA